jgi:hypothetical protein
VKEIFYTIMLASGFLVLRAQPTITYASNGPQVGQSFILYNATTNPSTPGNNGANQNWDFSSLSVTGTNSVFNRVDPLSTPGGSNFPSANIAVYENGLYEYYNSSSSVFLTVGGESSSDTLIYSADLLQYEFPFTYQNTATNFFTAIDYNGGKNVFWKGTENETADAYGSLKTPEGVYSNVLRLKITNVEIDSVPMQGTPFMDTLFLTRYLFLAPDIAYPVMSIITDSLPRSPSSTQTTFAILFPEGVNHVSLFQQSLHLFPNPAVGKTMLQLSLKQADKLTLSICNSMSAIVKSMPFAQLSAGKNEVPVDLSGLAAGEYMLLIKSDKEGNGMLKFSIY